MVLAFDLLFLDLGVIFCLASIIVWCFEGFSRVVALCCWSFCTFILTKRLLGIMPYFLMFLKQIQVGINPPVLY